MEKISGLLLNIRKDFCGNLLFFFYLKLLGIIRIVDNRGLKFSFTCNNIIVKYGRNRGMVSIKNEQHWSQCSVSGKYKTRNEKMAKPLFETVFNIRLTLRAAVFWRYNLQLVKNPYLIIIIFFTSPVWFYPTSLDCSVWVFISFLIPF